MWIRKSDEQAASERRHERRQVWLSYEEPAVVFLVCLVGFVGRSIIGPSRPVQAAGPTSFHEIFVVAAAVATMAAIVGYGLQIIFGRRLFSLVPGPKVDMCDTCHRVKRRDTESTCECGGSFEDIEEWTWVDDEESPDRKRRPEEE
jgi:hypothetical protein